MALSKRDKIILDMAGEGKTASEISEATGFPVTRVALEIDRLLKDANWLDDFQKIRLLLHSYYNLKGELERKAYEDGDAKSATDLIRLLRDMADLVDRMSQRNDANIEKVQSAHAKAMMLMIENAFLKSLTTLKKKFPEINESEVEEDFRWHLLEQVAKYDEVEQ